MATLVRTVQVDDLDGTESDALSTYTFDVNGKVYQIDLNDKNGVALTDIVETFETAMAPFIAAARVKGKKSKTTRKSSGSGRSDLAEIRAWAATNGIDVAPRGRVSADVISAYDARGKKKK
jgi:hypothetical protein